MSKITKTLLVLSLVGLLSGLLFVSGGFNSGGLVALHIVLPMGAIFFGLFLLSKVLEKETALYDQEQRAHLELAMHEQKPVQPAKPAVVETKRAVLSTH